MSEDKTKINPAWIDAEFEERIPVSWEEVQKQTGLRLYVFDEQTRAYVEVKKDSEEPK